MPDTDENITDPNGAGGGTNPGKKTGTSSRAGGGSNPGKKKDGRGGD